MCSEVRDVGLAHPLFKHLDTIYNAPPSPVTHEVLNKGYVQWEFDEDVAQGCANTVADRRVFVVYASLGEFCTEVVLPHPPVISTFLEDLLPLLFQSSKYLRDVPVLQKTNCIPFIVGPKATCVALLSF